MHPLEFENTGTASNSTLRTSMLVSDRLWLWLPLLGNGSGCHRNRLSFQFNNIHVPDLNSEKESKI